MEPDGTCLSLGNTKVSIEQLKAVHGTTHPTATGKKAGRFSFL